MELKVCSKFLFSCRENVLVNYFCCKSVELYKTCTEHPSAQFTRKLSLIQLQSSFRLRNCRDTEHYYSMVTVTNTNKPVNEIISALDVFCLYSVNFNSVSIIF